VGRSLLIFCAALGGCFGPRHSHPDGREMAAGDILPKIGPVRMAIHPHWIEGDTSHWVSPSLCLTFISTDGKDHVVLVNEVTIGFDEKDLTQSVEEEPRTVSSRAATTFTLQLQVPDEVELEDSRRVLVRGAVDGDKFERVYLLP